jgi:trimeric autotransporter adhesin
VQIKFKRKEEIMKINDRTRCPEIAVLFFACLVLSTTAHAVNPAPDGGYSGGNTAEGQNALFSLSTGGFNTAIGFLSLRSIATGQLNTGIGAGTLLANTADENTATGAGALLSNTTGSPNTANGAFALLSNTTGNNNNAFGAQALESNTTGPFNNAFGNAALASNTTGDRNTAMGEGALLANTTGAHNIAIGVSALRNNGTGNNNIAIGQDSCSQSSGGQFNTAVGSYTLVANTADGNTAVGGAALVNNSSGASNTATGSGALETNTAGSDNTANGLNALFANTGNDNTAVGFGAGAAATTGSNNVYIGADMVGVAGESNACYIKSIFGQAVATGLPVLIDSNNKLGTNPSSKRFKENIKPMGKASEALLALKPVTFRYKKEIDLTGRSQFGLVAEDVEKVNPDLIARDKEGKLYTVRYDQVNAMLLNEFLKDHKRVEEQQNNIAKHEATITELKSTVAQQHRDFQSRLAEQERQIAALTSGLQKVSAQVEIRKPASQMTLNNR